MSEALDLIVIGAGPGGYVAAIKAAQLGLKTALVEEREVGGTCLNRGCIPTKALVHAGETLENIKQCETLGLMAGDIGFDFAKMHARKTQVLTQMRTGIEGLLKANKVQLILGRAVVLSSSQVQVGEEILQTKRVLIATGSSPSRIPIPGAELCVTSDELLEGEGRFYKRLCIIGGGVIGMEFASIYAALGCQVTVIEAMDRVLPTMDREISQNLAMILKKRGVGIYTGARVSGVLQQDGGLVCQFEDKAGPRQVECDGVLISVGRRANTEGLLAPGLDLQIERGQIPVNGHYETYCKGIFAIGDVVKGGMQLAHVASAQGINAVCAMAGKDMPIDTRVVPSCIYTSPEIASVGLTADAAKEQGIETNVGKFIMSANAKSVIENAPRGFIKIVADAKTDVVLGAQLMCSRATDMLPILSCAVANKQTVPDLLKAMYPHPTFCEGIGEALEDVHGGAVHILPKRR